MSRLPKLSQLSEGAVIALAYALGFCDHCIGELPPEKVTLLTAAVKARLDRDEPPEGWSAQMAQGCVELVRLGVFGTVQQGEQQVVAMRGVEHLEWDALPPSMRVGLPTQKEAQA